MLGTVSLNAQSEVTRDFWSTGCVILYI